MRVLFIHKQLGVASELIHGWAGCGWNRRLGTDACSPTGPSLARQRNPLITAVVLAVIALGAWALKHHYSTAGVDRLTWALRPTAFLVERMTGWELVAERGQGYLCRLRGFMIAEPCAGINFMIAAFCMLGCTWGLRSHRFVAVAVGLGAALTATYAATIAVNAVRIVACVHLYELDIYHGGVTHDGAHRAAGAAIYFCALWLLYAGARPSTRKHGKAGMPPGWARPLAWYLAVALAVPVVNGLLLRRPGVPFGYVLTVVGIPLLVLAVGHAAAATVVLVHRRASAREA